MTSLQATQLTLAYRGSGEIVRNLSYAVQPGAITSIIGPNGCGKSTFLRALARLHKAQQGSVLLDGHTIHHLPTRDVARQLSLLAQHAQAPDGLTVVDLVRRGRYPHQSFLHPPTQQDEAAVERALSLVGLTNLRNRLIDELSGGQRQRAWIALAIAQETPILLLDEPTTYLDILHQREILNLLKRLNRDEKRTLVLVLHDVNDAMQISDQVVVMREGEIEAAGSPKTIITSTLLADVFGITCQTVSPPGSTQSVFIPISRSTLSRRSSRHAPTAALRADRLSAGYNDRSVLQDVTAYLPKGHITAIVGANGSGKSTLLRAFARLIKAQQGRIWLHKNQAETGSHRAFCQQVTFQMQGSLIPQGIPVEDLVAMGRRPHQRWYRQWSQEDHRVVEKALTVAHLQPLRNRPVESLSGGQQQRVWLAMALAQQTPILLLDEPTSFLDITHQVEVLEWVFELNRNEGLTVGMVLHDFGLACRYADHLIFLRDGRVIAAGAPEDIVTPALVEKTYGVQAQVMLDPLTSRPLVIPSPLG